MHDKNEGNYALSNNNYALSNNNKAIDKEKGKSRKTGLSPVRGIFLDVPHYNSLAPP